jgi:xanthine dehydrogenase/oxidase
MLERKQTHMSAPPSYEAAAAAAPLRASNELSFTLNGKEYNLDASTLSPQTTLAEFIRGNTKWQGTKISCGEGGCGACTVALTFSDVSLGKNVTRSVHSCLRPLLACGGMHIVTNDGLQSVTGSGKQPHEIQQRLADHNGSQCGYCSNGFVMTMYSLLAENAAPTKLQVEQEFDGNLCRCTGYRPILDAFKTFATDSVDCRKTGCKKRNQPFADIEELRPHNADVETKPYVHVPVPLHRATNGTAKLSVRDAATGMVWQDCATESDIDYWLGWYTTNNVATMLVCGQTSLAVYKDTVVGAKIHIGGVASLQGIAQDASGVTFGAAVTITSLVNFLETFKPTAGSPSYVGAHFPQAVKHLKRVGSTMLRNEGAAVGNMMLTHEHQSGADFFPSDVVTVMYGLGATVVVRDAIMMTVQRISMDKFFAQDFSGKYVVSVTLPYALENEVFMSYKIAIRQVNAHAIVNSAMRAQVDPTSKKVTGSPVVLYGGVWTKQTRVPEIEQALVGSDVSTAMKTVLDAAEKAIVPSTVIGRVSFRKSTAITYLYRFLLLLIGDKNLPAKYQSATAPWMTRAVSSGTQQYQVSKGEFPVSEPMPKIESIQQTTGKAVYTDDIGMPGVAGVFGALVLSTGGSSTIEAIDESAAQAMPGFVAFFCHKDIDKERNVWQNGEIFCSETINFNGQVVGVVVADSAAQAQRAAKAVKITYKDAKVNLTTLKSAIAEGSFVKNVPLPMKTERGDAAAAIAAAGKNQYTGTVNLGYQYHMHLENHVCYVEPCEDKLEVTVSTQMPVGIQGQIAATTGRTAASVVVNTKRCGGGYGGKITNSMLTAAVTGFCADKLELPVKIECDMQQTMKTLGCRGGVQMDFTVAWNAEGIITALKGDCYVACGSFPADDFGMAFVMLQSIDNCYNMQSMLMTSQLVTMNIPATTSARGPGWVPAVQLAEMVIARVASKSGIDPHTIRSKNFYKAGDTALGGMVLPYFNMDTIWPQLEESANVAARRTAITAFNTANRWQKKGLAMTPVRFGVGQAGANFDCVINVFPDATIGVTHGGCEIGQGINTKVLQVVAMKLGCSMNMIKINETSTRCISGASNVTGGSVTSAMCSLSVMHACDTLLRRLQPLRNAHKEWAGLIGAASAAGVELTATGWSSAPVNASGIFNYNSTGAAVTEVMLDVLSGEFEVLQTDILYDCGKSLNPMIDVGQIEGGFLFGMGYFVLEEVLWAPTTGDATNASTWEYKIPSALDVPVTFNTTFLKNSPNPVGVLSSKASGEPGTCLASSVVSALEDAVTAARQALNPAAPRWVCEATPLTVVSLQEACAVAVSDLVVS